jgi:hypothetical protein
MATEDQDQDQPELVSRKKISLKQRYDQIARAKRAALESEITSAPVAARSLGPIGVGRLGYGNVIVADSDPRDHILEFDRDAGDKIHVTDMDPNDPIGYPSDIIPTNPFLA